jgi:c-di-GMP-binding flagellar brake protein YcgR
MRERRKARRYHLALPMAIRAPIDNGLTPLYGETLDISTRGMYFTVDTELTVGMKLGLTLTAPTGPADGTRVFILAVGQVVRVEKRQKEGVQNVGSAAAIRRYEYFREGISDNSADWPSSLVRRFAQ